MSGSMVARESPQWRPWQRSLQHFFDHTGTDLTIGGLIVVSVALTLLELSLPDTPTRGILIEVNYAMSVTAHPAHDFRCWQYEQHEQITEMPKNAVFPGQSSGL